MLIATFYVLISPTDLILVKVMDKLLSSGLYRVRIIKNGEAVQIEFRRNVYENWARKGWFEILGVRWKRSKGAGCASPGATRKRP